MVTHSITRRLSLAVRGMRLPFLTVSILPYTYGAFLAPQPLYPTRFLLGLCAVACAHLSANLMNDYADSRTGVDWRDPIHRGYFGGSKLIQAGLATERTYLASALAFAAVGLACATVLALLLASLWAPLIFVAVQTLAWSYSVRPLQLSYARLGEACIFLLFGPASVLTGLSVQTMTWPAGRAVFGSLPFGFFTVAVLLANEVPDRKDDLAVGKNNLVNGLSPSLAWLPYLLSSVIGLVSVVWAWSLGLLGFRALFSLSVLFPVLAAAGILAKHGEDKSRVTSASKLALVAHMGVGLFLIMDALS